MHIINFKKWDELKDMKPYYNSDNNIFRMDQVAELKLDPKRVDAPSPYTMTLRIGSKSQQFDFTEETYQSVCAVIQALYDEYITKVINSYSTKQETYAWM